MLGQLALGRVEGFYGPDEPDGQLLVNIVTVQMGGLYQGPVPAYGLVDAVKVLLHDAVALRDGITIFHDAVLSLLGAQKRQKSRPQSSMMLSWMFFDEL